MNRSELDNQMDELARDLPWSPSWHGLKLEEDDGSYEFGIVVLKTLFILDMSFFGPTEIFGSHYIESMQSDKQKQMYCGSFTAGAVDGAMSHFAVENFTLEEMWKPIFRIVLTNHLKVNELDATKLIDDAWTQIAVASGLASMHNESFWYEWDIGDEKIDTGNWVQDGVLNDALIIFRFMREGGQCLINSVTGHGTARDALVLHNLADQVEK